MRVVAGFWHMDCLGISTEVIPCVRNFQLVGERILGDSFPKNPSPWISEPRKVFRGFSQRKFCDRQVARRADGHGFSRGTAASYAESVNFERWGLEH